ncbi:MAG: 3-dehydroquinate synthase [Firmicutes bacterium]|nr:3-dehydroquinate synthase [Bacillota bacterium]
MNTATVHINVGKGYHVTVGSGLLGHCGAIAGALLEPCRIAIITDTIVEGLYLPRAAESIAGAGFEVSYFAFPAGERSKSMGTLTRILEFLAGEKFTRTDCLAALGGGVAGDIAGFAAGCYLRGIRYLQLPTTLLAAVDSSVGGKTAVNLEAGKNLAGLFLQPEAVICDTGCFASLPPHILGDGTAEAVKTGILAGEELFSIFESGGAKDKLPEIVTRCVAYKGRIVEADELESGPRRLLNLGHTVGHAIEKLSGYRISHGHAVAAGMAVIARAALRLGRCSSACAARIEKTLLENSLPVTTNFTAAGLAAAALADKKRAGEEITLVLPREIGDCILWKIAVKELQGIIDAGMEPL